MQTTVYVKECTSTEFTNTMYKLKRCIYTMQYFPISDLAVLVTVLILCSVV